MDWREGDRDMRASTERKMKRWQEQRWILDQVIKVSGLDFDQGRSHKMLRNCGPGIAGELRGIGQRVQKFTDFPREFSRAAHGREQRGRAAEALGHTVEAREHYYVAATYYTAAQWGIFEDGNPKRMAWAESKRDCYDRYIGFADHPIERVDLPVPGGKMAALLHLPHKPAPGERFPCILYQPGMDGVKEDNPLMGDPLLQRGLAILSIDGPGQGETRERGITCTASNCEDGARAAYAFLSTRPEIDGDRVAVYGSSMGSYWGTRMAAAVPELKACAVVGVCMEPSQYTIFNTAAPTFKLNYMYMSGYDDEAEFDEFCKTLTLEGVAARIQCPYMVVAGEDDELCPIEFAYEVVDEATCPKVLYVYEGERHSLRNPAARTIVVDWLKDCLDGKPVASEKVYVEMSGKETRTPLS
ncbi:MAG: prolyl oligopeptidase family serine peptidase [Deltaproteobacteria bacterium]|nr:prolyl oligopeptidase family serine peptidase [Deltaproteobacteria bacterium]